MNSAGDRPTAHLAVRMIESLQKFFKTPAGMVVAGLLVIVGLFFAKSSVHSFTTSDAEDMASHRMFIDSVTGKPYPLELKVGMPFPCPAPSGGNTGYPAELCYWTADGKTKKDPTYVLLNSYKGSNEPTFCPDCGRLVVGHNPPPHGQPPPPTKAEYEKRGLGRHAN